MKRIYSIAMAVWLSPALSSQELDSLVNIMKNEGTASKWSATEIQTAKDTSAQTDTNEAVNVSDIPEAPEAPGLPDNVLHESEPSPEVQVIEEDVEFEFDDGPEYVFENDNRDDGNDRDDERKRHSRFKGHWAGAEIGLNNYFDEDFSLQRDGDSVHGHKNRKINGCRFKFCPVQCGHNSRTCRFSNRDGDYL
jgi:hypothetical protein